MATTASMLNSLVSITQFNKGQASKIFDRLKNEQQLIVLKNNSPSAVILSPEEYERFAEIEENYKLLLMAIDRLENTNLENLISETDILSQLNLTQQDVDEAEDVEIE